MFNQLQRRHLADNINDAFAKVQGHIQGEGDLEGAVEEIRCNLVDGLGVSFDLLDSLADERGACWTDEGKDLAEQHNVTDLEGHQERAVMDIAAALAKLRQGDLCDRARGDRAPIYVEDVQTALANTNALLNDMAPVE